MIHSVDEKTKEKITEEPLLNNLRSELERRKKTNPSYSLRAFAKYLEMDASNLSKLLSGRIELGTKLRMKLAQKLGMSEEELRHFGYLEGHIVKDSDYIEHQLDHFKVISDWYHYAILEVLKLEEFRFNQDESDIANRLGLSLEEYKNAVKRLIKLGHLKLGEDNRLIDEEVNCSSILSIDTSSAHRTNQKQILSLAQNALDETPIEKRSQSAMTVAIDSKKIPEAKKMIKEFRRKLARFLSTSKHLDEVYHLSLSLYPVTRSRKGE
jgi:transcriptional regulator with XRE-family HTH domain